jgi:hypothetical protein
MDLWHWVLLIAWSAWLCIVWRCARSGQPRTVARIKHAHMRPDHRSQVRKCAGRLHGESALLRTWQGPPISGSAGTRCYSWGGLSNGPGSVLSSTTVGVPAGLAIAAAAYFGVAAFFVLACLLLYGLVLPRLPYIRERERAAAQAQRPGGNLAIAEAVRPAAMRRGPPCCRWLSQRAGNLSSRPWGIAAEPYIACVLASQARRGTLTGRLRVSGDAQPDGKPGAATAREVARAVGVLAAAMVLIYVLTLAIFPGVLAEDVSNTALGTWCAPGHTCSLRTHGLALSPYCGAGEEQECMRSCAVSLPDAPMNANMGRSGCTSGAVHGAGACV